MREGGSFAGGTGLNSSAVESVPAQLLVECDSVESVLGVWFGWRLRGGYNSSSSCKTSEITLNPGIKSRQEKFKVHYQ